MSHCKAIVPMTFRHSALIVNCVEKRRRRELHPPSCLDNTLPTMRLCLLGWGSDRGPRQGGGREEMSTSVTRSDPQTGAALLVKSLEAQGVEYIFGIPGAKIDKVFDTLLDSRIKTVVCRHEQNAAFIAGGIGRMTGKAGVALVTSGPGCSNLVTGLATANSEGDPVVAIGGAVSISNRLKQIHQSMDTVNLFRPVTKFSAEIDSPEAVSEVVANAFRTAESGRPGAAFISAPQDIMSGAADGEMRPWDWTSTIVNTGHPGASFNAQAPPTVPHAPVQRPGRPRIPRRPEEPVRNRPAAQAEARTHRPLEGHRQRRSGEPLPGRGADCGRAWAAGRPVADLRPSPADGHASAHPRGTDENRAASPSAIVGWVRMASRSAV
jgi:sulfopyruvate decarboxylase TPP-binding subunit